MVMQAQLLQPSRTGRYPLWLLLGFWVGVAISIAVVIRRLLELIRPSYGGTTVMAEMNATFSSHARLTIAHIIPAAIFVLLAVAVLFHVSEVKWLQRLFFVFGVITSATAYAMNLYAVGGWVERSAVLVFNTWFLFSLSRALWFYVRAEHAKQREWTSRAVGILLGIATTRPVMGVFFATSARTHLSPNQFFGIAFWIGFSINAVAIEFWLHSKRRGQLHKPELLLQRLQSSSSVL